MAAVREFGSFREFYAFYLSEHANRTSRRLHVVGTSLAVILMAYALVNGIWWLVPVSLIPGYALAWVGHFFFEHNRPATFKHPLYSFCGDFVMLRDVLSGRIPW